MKPIGCWQDLGSDFKQNLSLFLTSVRKVMRTLVKQMERMVRMLAALEMPEIQKILMKNPKSIT